MYYMDNLLDNNKLIDKVNVNGLVYPILDDLILRRDHRQQMNPDQ
jgi:hypothetical protein